MSSRFVTISPQNLALADSFTADQVIGNRLKLKKDVVVRLGNPTSPDTEVWKAGFLSPPVYSWVQKTDGLYWVVGELKPIRYVKHSKSDFELIPDSGGAEFMAVNGDNGWFTNPFENFEKNIKDTLKILVPVAVVGVGIYALGPVASFFIKSKIAKKSK
ncbi:hypothetical protein [Gracilimonas sediminicola]|uniref:hypothetical protein n=1 Tax=Gracilimonas sediminicola TaxID=2952158 RepID=UPI0038D3A8F9